MKCCGYKLIAVDMDGTLLNDQNCISVENLRLLHRATENDVKVILTTGRPTVGLNRYVSSFSFDFPTITYNGAVVSMLKTKRKLYSQSLTANDAEKIIEFGKKHNLSMCIWSDDALYVVDATNDWISKYKDQFEVSTVLLSDFSAVLKQITKILFLNIESFKQTIDSVLIPCLIETKSFFTSKRGNIEFIHNSVSKENALEFLCDYYGFNFQETIAIGDSETDLQMIKCAGLGIAMKNALDEVKFVADYVTLSNDEDGVAYALNHHLFPDVC